MALFDLSLRLDQNVLLFPGDPAPELLRLADLRRGDPLTASLLRIGCHVGTHVDAPAHFLADGATVDQLPLASFAGEAVVLELPDCDAVTPEVLLPLAIPSHRHLLLKTRNSALLAEPRFREDYCFLTPAAINVLLARRPRSIGFDYYSLDPYTTTDFPAHTAAARHGIPVFVCLNLAGVPPGAGWFCAAPLSVANAEGMPVRAILLREDASHAPPSLNPDK